MPDPPRENHWLDTLAAEYDPPPPPPPAAPQPPPPPEPPPPEPPKPWRPFDWERIRPIALAEMVVVCAAAVFAAHVATRIVFALVALIWS